MRYYVRVSLRILILYITQNQCLEGIEANSQLILVDFKHFCTSTGYFGSPGSSIWRLTQRTKLVWLLE